MLRRRWLTIAVITLVTLAVIGVATLLTPKVYASSARVYVSFAGERADGSISAATQISSRLTDYAMVGTAPAVMEEVIKDLNLNTTPKGLKSSITVTQPTGTNSLIVTADAPTSEEATVIANSVSEHMIKAIEDLETPPGSKTSLIHGNIIDPAEAGGGPISPNVKNNLAIGLIVGLLIGVAVAFLRDAVDRSVKSTRALENMTGRPILAVVPFDPDAQETPIIPSGAKSNRAESFRMLRTNLQYVDVDNRPKIIVVASALAGEGKSTTAINLALTLALNDAKVLVLEADLRKPKIAQYLGIAPGRGLTDVLAGTVPWQDCVVPWQRGLLDTLTEGDAAPNPTELLASHRMATLLAELRDAYDYVVVDSPPLLPVSDGAVLAGQADGVLLVVRHGMASNDSVSSAVASLRGVDARILGTVFTCAPSRRRGDRGYRYGYGYGYGYGDYYGDGVSRTGITYEMHGDEGSAGSNGEVTVPADDRGATPGGDADAAPQTASAGSAGTSPDGIA